MPNDMSTEYYGSCDEYFKDTNFLRQVQKPDDFQQKLQTLKEKAPYVLAEFKTAYVLYNKNPEYPDYQQIFANAQSNVDNISSQMFTLLNDIQFNLYDLNKKMLCLNTNIEEEKNKNKILKKRNGIVEEQNNAASELIYDYKKHEAEARAIIEAPRWNALPDMYKITLVEVTYNGGGVRNFPNLCSAMGIPPKMGNTTYFWPSVKVFKLESVNHQRVKIEFNRPDVPVRDQSFKSIFF
jgi:hypothetical protein